MHSRTATLFALVCVTALFTGCEVDQPLALVTGTAPLASAAAGQKVPSDLALTASPGEIALAWRDNSPNETAFQVLRSTTGQTGAFTTVATTAANVTTYSDPGLDPKQQYCYKIQAVAQKRILGVSNTACAIPQPLQPIAASNVDAQPTSTADIQVTWTDNSWNEGGFRVERAPSDAGPWATLATTAPNATRAYDGAATEQLVCYRVVAFNTYGDAKPSNADCTAVPAPPTNLAATSVDGQTVDVAWADNSGFEDGYQVERCCDLGGWSVAANLPANATSYRDAGLTVNTAYYYRVGARKDSYSAFAFYVRVVTVAAPPPAPSGTQAWPISSSAVAIVWNASSITQEGFRVERSTDGGASWVAVATTGAGEPFPIDEGRTPEQQVCYRVFASNARGESDASNIACTAPPLGPTALGATTVDEQTIDITWTDNSAVEDGYVVLVPAFDEWGNPIEEPVAWLPANATSYRATGLVSGGLYTYFIAATRDGGSSDQAGIDVSTDPATVAAQGTTATRTRTAPSARSGRSVRPRVPTQRPPAAVAPRR